MRGGAQAHLIQADDGNCYVVKFSNNPQHPRILVNEWLATAVLAHLRIQTPQAALIECGPDFLASNPDVYIQLGTQRVEPRPGWHYASRYPGDPDRLAVYDFVPDQLLSTTYNLPDFSAVVAVDKWLGNSDSRQAIFFRAQVKEFAPEMDAHPLRKVFVAQMIDHGFVFNGPHWDFQDSPLQGLYFRHQVYDRVVSLDSFEPWLSQIENFPVEALDRAFRAIPPEWVEEGMAELEQLVEKLIQRRGRVRGLIEATKRGTVSPFRNWQ
jgi:hypothetical protein